MKEANLSRRDFLAGAAAAGGFAALGLAGCAPKSNGPANVEQVKTADTGAADGGEGGEGGEGEGSGGLAAPAARASRRRSAA